MKHIITISIMLAMVPLTSFARGGKSDVSNIVSVADGVVVASENSTGGSNPAGLVYNDGFGLVGQVGGFDEIGFGGGFTYGKGHNWGMGINYYMPGGNAAVDSVSGGVAFHLKGMNTSMGLSAVYLTDDVPGIDELQLNFGLVIMPWGKFSLGISAQGLGDTTTYGVGLKFDVARMVRLVADFTSNDGDFGAWGAKPGIQLIFGSVTLHGAYGIGLTDGRADDEFNAGLGVMLGSKLSLVYDWEGLSGEEHFLLLKFKF